MSELNYISGELVGKRYKPGLRFDYTLSIPQVEAEEFGLLLDHDGKNDANVDSMLALADEGKAPYCIGVGVRPGFLTMPDGEERNMRMNSYDLFDREYADFVVYELLPYITEKHGLMIAASGDMHMVSGGSSGGISAFAIAWFHPEAFRRVHICSPSFLAMGRGNELPYLVRKYETKPLRIYQEWSENEPNDYFGSSRAIDEEMDKGFTFAGYDYTSAFFPGEGHSSRYRDYDQAYKRNRWLWQDHQVKPVKAPANSPRVDQVIPYGSKWERCDAFPEKESEQAPAALADYGCLALSRDGLSWYGGYPNDDIVYMHVADDNISMDKRLLHATLHTIPRICPKGTIAMAVDAVDRLYVLTAIGIQCVRAFGLIDVILELPDNSKPVDIAITDALYIKTEEGIYRRALQEDCTGFTHPTRKYTSYYD